MDVFYFASFFPAAAAIFLFLFTDTISIGMHIDGEELFAEAVVDVAHVYTPQFISSKEQKV